VVEDARLTLVFDTRPWGTAPALADEHGAVANLLVDVAPHQLDLLAFLLGSPIKRVRSEQVRFSPGRAVELDCAVEMAGGTVVRCTIGHLPHHEERFAALVGGRRMVADPWAAGWAGSPLARMRPRLSELGAHVLGRPSPTNASFAAQLRSFAAWVGGAAGGDLADGGAGLAACAAADAILASAQDGSAWIDVTGEVP
jgi:predicted dehydrogenase